MGEIPYLEALAGEIVVLARRIGCEMSLDQARDMLWEAGVGDVIDDLAVARSVITAADQFHPVARFFVEGSPEREFVERLLSDPDRVSPRSLGG